MMKAYRRALIRLLIRSYLQPRAPIVTKPELKAILSAIQTQKEKLRKKGKADHGKQDPDL